MSRGDYKPDKKAWVNGGFGEEAGRGTARGLGQAGRSDGS